MNPSCVEFAALPTRFAPDGVPYAVILPPGYDRARRYPLCLVLHGGGGSHHSLADTRPLLDAWWEAGLVPPMVLASVDAGPMSFYFGPWEPFIADEFLAHLRRSYAVGDDRGSTLITGISMGGYGSLKIAFARPDRFAAVAALQPMIEPGLRASDAGWRNRFYYPGGGPDELLGPRRDPALFEANNPATRLRDNATAIRDSGLAIYVEAGDDDLLNAHDGAEFLHRLLWDLDISHEYHLVRGADHVGPSLAPRMREAFAWLGAVASSRPAASDPDLDAQERAWMAWIEGGSTGEPPPPLPPLSDAMIRVLRAQCQPARDAAAQRDVAMRRRYAILPPTS